MTAATTEPAPPKAGLLGRPIVLVGLLVAVMGAEAGAFLLLLPEPHAESEHDESDGHGGHAATGDGDSVEVMVDSFSTTNSRAAAGSVIHVTFKLTAIIPTGQEIAFEHAANQHHNARVRQSVLKVARSASLDDLNDPALTTIRRQLREEINKVLRKSYVTEVVISDFKTMEQ